MLDLNEPSSKTDVVIHEQKTTIEIGGGTLVGTRVSMPSVPQLLRGVRGVSHTSSANEPHVKSFESASFASEMARLLEQYDEFHDSETYLVRLSGLASLMGDWQRAREFSRDAIKLNADPELRYRAADYAARAGDVALAQKEWTALADEEHLLSILRLAEIAVAQGEYEEGRGYIDKAMALDGEDWRVQMLAGTFCLVVGEHAEAVRHFRTARIDRQNSVALYFNLALAHILCGNAKRALRELRVAVGLNPFGQKSLVAWADLSAHLGEPLSDVSFAIARYLRLYDDDKPLTDRLAHLYYLQDDLTRSSDVLKEAARRFDDPSIANNLGVISTRKRELRKAIQEFSTALRQSRDDSTSAVDRRTAGIATANLVGVLNEAGSFEDAARVSEAYMALNEEEDYMAREPECRIPEAYVWAMLNLQNGDEAIQRAQSWVGQNLNLKSKVSLASTLVCYFYSVKKDLKRAYRYALLAYEAQNEDKSRDFNLWNTSLNNLAFIAIESGNLEDAGHYLARVRAESPRERRYVYATKGLLAIRRGQIERGEHYYRAAISNAHDKTTKNLLRLKLNWELAKHSAHVGQKERALRLLSRVRQTRLAGIWTLPFVKREADALERKLKGGADPTP
ncbi:MAG: hypothetical protein GKR94_17380 [Gammaproteobacteria bacterium]|nr:hypothetical protein [Gammaproteobacteria bacterium]